jgi:hypothetical protein
MDVKQFATAISGATDDAHIGRNMWCTRDARNNFKI